jgi:thiol-disulfide isomerase/thioredoxin
MMAWLGCALCGIFVIIFRIMVTHHPISRRKLLAAAGGCLAIPSGICALDFQVKFKAKTLDGENFTGDSVRGKVVLIQFWATWCPYCRRDAPAFDAIVQEFQEQGLVALAVDIAESKSTVTKFLAESPRNCKIVLMTDTNLADWFSPKSFPHYAVIDRYGRVAGEQKGAGGEQALRYLLGRAGLRTNDSGDPGELSSSPSRS